MDENKYPIAEGVRDGLIATRDIDCDAADIEFAMLELDISDIITQLGDHNVDREAGLTNDDDEAWASRARWALAHKRRLAKILGVKLRHARRLENEDLRDSRDEARRRRHQELVDAVGSQQMLEDIKAAYLALRGFKYWETCDAPTVASLNRIQALLEATGL